MAGGSAASPDSRYSAGDTSPRGSRKVSTYGGSRAWSENEEAYLLEARQNKTPYKHIANHLQKTELACRLHFHQLAYGTKRKRRSTSTSSVTTTRGSRNPSVQATGRSHVSQRSIDSTSSRLSAEHHPPTMYTSAISPPNSPPPAQRRRLARSESPPHMDSLNVPHATYQAATTRIPSSSTFFPFVNSDSPFPQLPHFNRRTFVHPSASPSAFSNQSFASIPSLLPPHSLAGTDDALTAPSEDKRHSSYHPSPATAPFGFGATAEKNVSNNINTIDPHRLNNIYVRNRYSFWSQISHEYGGNISPTALEASFLRQSAGSPTGSLPTPPNRSPVMPTLKLNGEERDHVGRGDRSERDSLTPESRRGSGETTTTASCSIANLLTEEREVWERARGPSKHGQKRKGSREDEGCRKVRERRV